MSKIPYSSLYCVASQEEKYKELCLLMGLADLKWAKIRIIEPQNMNLHSLLEEKIERVKTQLPYDPFFVELTGLLIDSWKGLPGGLTRVFMDTLGNDISVFCKMMQAFSGDDRIARAISVIGYYNPDGANLTFEGETIGSIAPSPRGKKNFGWDPIFIPEGSTKTYGEMTLEEKNQTSMRRIAVDKFMKYLDAHFELKAGNTSGE
jgi:XTP/dITP diphosphohydrolase